MLPGNELPLIDENGLEPLSPAAPGRVFAFDGGRVLKVLPAAGLEGVERVFAAVEAAHAAGAPIVRTLEAVRTSSGYGLVMERIEGPSLAELLAHGELSAREAAEVCLRCMHTLHALRSDDAALRDVRELMGLRIETASRVLPGQVCDELSALLLGVQRSNRLLHGDLHVGNVLLAEGGPVLIDATTVCAGNPVFELGLSCSSMHCECQLDPQRTERFFGLPASVVDEVWEELLDSYAQGIGADGRASLERMTQLIGLVALLARIAGGQGLSSTEGLTRALAARKMIVGLLQEL